MVKWEIVRSALISERGRLASNLVFTQQRRHHFTMQNPEFPNSNTPPDLSKETPPASTPPPPNNPYEVPNSAPGAPPNMAPPAPPGAPVTTDVIGQSWEMLKPQIGMWIVAMLIYGAITGAFSGIGAVIGGVGGQNPSEAINILLLLLNVLSTLVGFLIAAGLMKMAIHHVRSGQADISKLFDIYDVIPAVIIAGIVTTIAFILGFALLIIPGLS